MSWDMSNDKVVVPEVKNENEVFYDPVTGLCNPKSVPKPPPPCANTHTYAETFWEPCVDCEKYCNCHWKYDWPNVIVRTLDWISLEVSSAVVRGSIELQIKVLDMQEKEVQGKVEVDGEGKVVDLRTDKEPTYGITKSQWKLIETFQTLHLERVDRDVTAEKEANDYYKRTGFPRPKKDYINFWGYDDWEEKMFADMPQIDFFGIMQAKHDLRMVDFHLVLEKWLSIFKGIPMVKEFGKGHYLKKMDKEAKEAGCGDFIWGKPKINWAKGNKKKMWRLDRGYAKIRRKPCGCWINNWGSR